MSHSLLGSYFSCHQGLAAQHRSVIRLTKARLSGREEQQWSRVYSTSPCRVLPLCLWLPAFFVVIFKRTSGVGTRRVNVFSVNVFPNSLNYFYKLSDERVPSSNI